jgi:hypothetical protein
MTANNEHPLRRDGTGQPHRFPAALHPSYAKVDERSIRDWLRFAAGFASELRFFNDQNQPDGDWQHFFSMEEKQWQQLETNQEVPPHLSLFITFLKLVRYAQDDLNDLTRRHLDFYFEKILGLRHRDGQPDKIHVVFELTKNALPALLEKGTALDAGKDSIGKNLRYRLDDSIVVNRAIIADKLSIYHPPGVEEILRFASVADSADGEGAPNDESNLAWPAFGGNHLPVAQTGFAVSSPLLLLKDGDRTIELIIHFDQAVEMPEVSLSENAFDCYFSSEKEWIGPFSITPELIQEEGQLAGLKITCLLSAGDPPVTNVDAELLEGAFESGAPVMQIKVASPAFHGAIKDARIATIKLAVEVNNIKTVTIENDEGPLDPKKPFKPFGSQPVKGSSFYLGYEELLYKDLDSLSLQIQWHQPPANFESYYSGYHKVAITRLGAGDERIESLTSVSGIARVLADENRELAFSSKRIPAAAITTYTNEHFKARLYLKNNFKTEVHLFHRSDANHSVTVPALAITEKRHRNFFRETSRYAVEVDRRYQASARKNKTNGSPSAKIRSQGFGTGEFIPEELKTRFLRLELLHDFGHRRYPRLLILAAQQQKNPPNEPYTPAIQSLKLSYKASTEEVRLNATSAIAFQRKELCFYHLDVFGAAERHGYLKTKTKKYSAKAITLLPVHRAEGEFIFSLENATPLQTVNVLFQVAEGTANPEKEAQEISWSVLCSNEWKKLTREHVLSDSTHHLLRSGIVRINLPAEATADNTLLPAGKYWLRAQVAQHADAVCKIIALHTQAAQAVFDEEENEVNHLAKVLPPHTVSKLVTRHSSIKKVTQPYASFGGQQREESDNYRTRTSERLRHKQRGVVAWDYERLVLQQFPSVYKVKCLGHSAEENDCCSYRRPGQVTLVVIPDLKNQTPVNPLQPKTPLDTLTAIENYLKPLSSMFISLHTQNPEYEELQLDFKVRFHRNFEFGYYSKQLNQALVQFLSPWAFDPSREISFGGRIHKSVLLNWVEEISYVDFVTDFKMVHLTGSDSSKKEVNEIEVINPSAILVSHAQHLIQPLHTSGQ